MTQHTARPLSLINRILFPLCAAAGVAAAVRGNLVMAVVVLVALAVVAVSVHRARLGRGSTNERVSALQPYDERDRVLLDRSYSLLGQILFVAQTLMLLVAALTGGDVAGEGRRLLAVCAITVVATTLTVRRG